MRLSRRDEARFVGRGEEMRLFDELFVPEPPVSVVHVYGPGGIGKSALVRAVARAGETRGWRPFLVEGRDLPPKPDALEAALAGARDEERPLVVFDTYERLGALDGYLRGRLLPELSERAIIVCAGRRPPAAAWFQDGWESLVRAVPLRPLDDEGAGALLRSRGVEDAEDVRIIAAWAGGSPLALTLAAEAAASDEPWRLDHAAAEPERVGMLVRRLVDNEVAPDRRAVLEVASMPRVTTAALLHDVLGESASFDWLAGLSFAEPLRDGLTLHDLVRRAVRNELRTREPERERELRRRVADHLHALAIDGRPALTVDLADLVENELIRSFYSWDGSGRYRMDSVRRGDAEAIRELLEARGYAAWWPSTEPFFTRAPEFVSLARDADDAIVGMAVAVTPAAAPPFADEDPLLGPWLRDARERVPDGNVIVWRDSYDFLSPALEKPTSPIQAMLNMAGVLQSGLANPRFAYLPIDSAYGSAVSFSSLLGGARLEHLDVHAGGRSHACHFVDYGPGGLLGKQRDVVYAELALAPPGLAGSGSGAAASGADAAVDADAVRDALRNFALAGELARSPLASGSGAEERAESVRRRLREAIDGAFAASSADEQLRRVLVAGYLDPAPSHELAADALHLSRSAYFRRLKAAVDRVAVYLAADA